MIVLLVTCGVYVFHPGIATSDSYVNQLTLFKRRKNVRRPITAHSNKCACLTLRVSVTDDPRRKSKSELCTEFLTANVLQCNVFLCVFCAPTVALHAKEKIFRDDPVTIDDHSLKDTRRPVGVHI